MIGRYDAAVGGTWLSEISEQIIVTDIREEEAKSRISTANRAIGDGLRFIRRQRQSVGVSISFVIWEQDTERRKDILSRVQAWANGAGIQQLQISDRRGQFLLVRCTEPPSMASTANWQDEIRMLFTAYELPIWQDSEQARATITGTGTLFVPGSGETLVDVEITNNGGTANAVTVSCGEDSMTFSGISLGKGQTLSISHDERGLLSAKIGSASVLANRTAESADDLTAVCGAYNHITVSGGTLSAVFKARGVYL